MGNGKDIESKKAMQHNVNKKDKNGGVNTVRVSGSKEAKGCGPDMVGGKGVNKCNSLANGDEARPEKRIA